MTVGDPIAPAPDQAPLGSRPGVAGSLGAGSLGAGSLGAGSLVDAVLHATGEHLGPGSSLEWAGVDAGGLRTAARAIRCAISALEHQERLVLAEIGTRRAFTVDGSRDVADWSANNLGISRRVANEQVQLAEQLADMPRLADAAAAGAVTREQARPAADLARAAGTDVGWAAQAPHLPVGTLSRQASKHRRPSAADHRAARNARHFRAWEDGLELRFRGSLPADDGARLLAAIERGMPVRRRAAGSSASAPDQDLTSDQRRADGLLALAKATLSGDVDPDRATITAVVELAAICDDDPGATAELEAGQPLATETARRLVCDGRLQIVVQDRDGVTVGVGTTARVVSPAMRRALLRRDGGCRFGGCTATRFLEAHHVVPWPSPTTMGNLAMICWHHHHAVHEGGWQLHGEPNGALHATHANGTTVTSLPRDRLPDPRPGPSPARIPESRTGHLTSALTRPPEQPVPLPEQSGPPGGDRATTAAASTLADG